MAMELAQSKQELLEKYTRPKTIKALEIDVEPKQAEELAKRAAWDLNKTQAAKLEKQIAACTLKAPTMA